MPCNPDDCTVVLYELSDPRLETFTNIGDADETDIRTYPVPEQDDPLGNYSLYPNPQMRDVFAMDIGRAMKNHPKRQELGCGKGCGCSESTDPKDAMRTSRRIGFTTEFTYNDGGKATLSGSYQLTATRIKGFCTPGATAEPPPRTPVDPSDSAKGGKRSDGDAKRKGKKTRKSG